MGPAVFWWGRGIIEHLHHDKDGQKKDKDFSIHGVKPPIFDFALITH